MKAVQDRLPEKHRTMARPFHIVATTVCFLSLLAATGCYPCRGDGELYLNSVEYAEGTYVAYGMNRFVAVAPYSDSVYFSEDAEIWERIDFSETLVPKGVSFGAGVFVITGNGGSDSAIVVSTDGQTWTPVLAGAGGNMVGPPSYVDGRFISRANWFHVERQQPKDNRVAWSSDGLSWEWSDEPYFDAMAIAHDDGVFVAASGDRILRSTEGVNWQKTRNANHRENFNGVTHGPAGFLVVGGTNNEILVSDDGKSWETVYSKH